MQDQDRVLAYLSALAEDDTYKAARLYAELTPAEKQQVEADMDRMLNRA